MHGRELKFMSRIKKQENMTNQQEKKSVTLWELKSQVIKLLTSNEKEQIQDQSENKCVRSQKDILHWKVSMSIEC